MRSCTYIPDVSLYVQFGNLMTQQKCSTLISHLAAGMHLIHRLVTPRGQQQFSLNVPRKLPSFQAAGQVPPGVSTVHMEQTHTFSVQSTGNCVNDW